MQTEIPEPAQETQPEAVRMQLIEFLHGGSAHVDVKTALANVPEALYGAQPANAPHTLWQLLEHLRFTLHDLLEFCTNSEYTAPEWPDDYWPGEAKPSAGGAWQAATKAFLADLAAFEKLVKDPLTDLNARIPWGQGQTMFREVLLAIDHTSYHLGQIVLLRKQLESWEN